MSWFSGSDDEILTPVQLRSFGNQNSDRTNSRTSCPPLLDMTTRGFRQPACIQ